MVYVLDVDSQLNLVISRLGFRHGFLVALFADHSMIVCHCMGVSDREIRRCVRAGGCSVNAVSEACGAASGCGGCRPAVSKIVESELEAHRRLPMLQAALIVTG